MGMSGHDARETLTDVGRLLPPLSALLRPSPRCSQERIRPRRDGAANRAALRSALKSAAAASRAKSAGRLRPGGAAAAAAAADTRTVKQKIEDERKCESQCGGGGWGGCKEWCRGV